MKSRTLALCYFIFSAIFVFTIDRIVPPFEAPDEFEHMLKAASLASGQVFPVRTAASGISWRSNSSTEGENAGGRINDSILAVFRTLAPTCCLAQPVAAEAMTQAGQMKWASTSTFTQFPVAGQYGPILYLPQALGLAIGRGVGLPVLRSYRLARILNGLAALGVGSIAIANAGGGAFVMAVVLSTPMYLFLATSVSQDGMLVAVTALFAALTLVKPKSFESRTRDWIRWLCALLMAMGRPPYGLLSFLLIRKRGARSLRQWLGAPDGPLAPILIGLIAISWLAAVGSPKDSRFDRKAQLARLLQHPSSIVWVAIGTIEHDEYLRVSREVVGVLGWLNVELPVSVYTAGQLAIALAALTCFLQIQGRPLLECLAGAALFALSLAAMYGAAYVAFNPVDQGFVEGIQGRYLLPYLVALPLIIPSLIPARWRASPEPVVGLEYVWLTLGLLAWGMMFVINCVALSVLHRVYGG